MPKLGNKEIFRKRESAPPDKKYGYCSNMTRLQAFYKFDITQLSFFYWI